MIKLLFTTLPESRNFNARMLCQYAPGTKYNCTTNGLLADSLSNSIYYTISIYSIYLHPSMPISFSVDIRTGYRCLYRPQHLVVTHGFLMPAVWVVFEQCHWARIVSVPAAAHQMPPPLLNYERQSRFHLRVIVKRSSTGTMNVGITYHREMCGTLWKTANCILRMHIIINVCLWYPDWAKAVDRKSTISEKTTK